MSRFKKDLMRYTTPQMRIVAVIPCYDVAQVCTPVIEKALPFVQRLILVDDGSTDSTRAQLSRTAQAHPEKIELIVFACNRGKGDALHTGIGHALQWSEWEVLVTLDSDGQHLPEELPRIAAGVMRGADLVIGERDFAKMPFFSRIPNKIFSFILRTFYGRVVVDTQSGYRALSRDFAREVFEFGGGGRYEMETRCILLALHRRREIQSVSISTVYFDKNRASHFSKWRDTWRILGVLVSFLWTHRNSNTRGDQ